MHLLLYCSIASFSSALCMVRLFFLLWLLRPTMQLLGDLVCRACGEHLFSAAAHAHGTHLSGPRVSSAAHDPALGEGGTVHTLRKSASAGGAGGSVAVAVYSEAVSLRAGRAVTPSLFPGYTQTRVACARCEAAVGWHFSRAEGSSAGAGGSPGGGARAEGALSADAKPSGSGASLVVPYVEEEALARLQHLGSMPCLVHPNPLGWWTYSFCHTVSVEQYHEGTRWSMGVFEAERKVGARVGRCPWQGASAQAPLETHTPSHAPPSHPAPPPTEGAPGARAAGLLHLTLLRARAALR